MDPAQTHGHSGTTKNASSDALDGIHKCNKTEERHDFLYDLGNDWVCNE